jgi:hypothetical protein
MLSRAPFLNAWNGLETSATQFYRGLLGCC